MKRYSYMHSDINIIAVNSFESKWAYIDASKNRARTFMS